MKYLVPYLITFPLTELKIMEPKYQANTREGCAVELEQEALGSR